MKKFVTHKVLRLHVINVLLIEPRISENDLNSGTFKVFQVKKSSYIVHFDKREIQSVSDCAQHETKLSLSLFSFYRTK